MSKLIQLNFIPERLLFLRKRKRKCFRLAATAAICALLILAPLTAEWLNAARARELEQERGRINAALTEQRAKLRDTTDRTKQLRAQLDRANVLRSKRGWAGLVATISGAMPQGVWLTSLGTNPAKPSSSSVQRIAAASPKPGAPAVEVPNVLDGPTELVLEGYAQDHMVLWDFIQEVKQTEMFQDVTLVRSGVEPVLNSSAVRFNISCRW